MRGEGHPRVLAGRGEAGAEAAEDLALLLDGVPERGPGLVAEPEEEVGRGGADARHDDADAHVRDGVGGVLEVDAQIRGDPVREERPGARAAVLVGDHRADEEVAREPCARTDNCVDGVHHRGDAALVVVRPHAPDPAVLELGTIGVDAPAAHLDPRVHVPVQHETRPAPRAGEPADRLPADDGRVAGARNVHHLDFEPDAGHVFGEEVRDRLLLEGRARDPDEGPLEVEHPLGVHEPLGLDAPDVGRITGHFDQLLGIDGVSDSPSSGQGAMCPPVPVLHPSSAARATRFRKGGAPAPAGPEPSSPLAGEPRRRLGGHGPPARGQAPDVAGPRAGPFRSGLD